MFMMFMKQVDCFIYLPLIDACVCSKVCVSIEKLHSTSTPLRLLIDSANTNTSQWLEETSRDVPTSTTNWITTPASVRQLRSTLLHADVVVTSSTEPTRLHSNYAQIRNQSAIWDLADSRPQRQGFIKPTRLTIINLLVSVGVRYRVIRTVQSTVASGPTAMHPWFLELIVSSCSQVDVAWNGGKNIEFLARCICVFRAGR